LKIVRIIARLNVGGPARHVVLLDRGLRERGHDCLLVHGQPEALEGTMEADAAAVGVRLVSVEELGRRVSVLSDARAFVRLLQIIWAESPDVVHTHTAKAGTLGRLAAFVFNLTRTKRKRCLVVHTFHGHVLSGYFSSTVSRLIILIERGLSAISDRIVTISPSQKHDLVERFHVAPPAKAVVIPLGLDLKAFENIDPDDHRPPPWLDIPAGSVVIGYVGRLVPIKNIGMLLTVFAQLHAQRPDSYLVIAGDGPLRGELENAVRSMGIAPFVRFTGWTSDLADLYRAFHVCVLASHNEGTPVALIEAMAAARPVVATAVGGVSDVVESGRTGLLVPPADAKAMAEAIDSLLGDDAGRRTMSRAARAGVARFAPGRLVSDIESLYVTVLSRKRNVDPSVLRTRMSVVRDA
jgi:glycosyltransferase involved in cell wall biosynthesis